MSVRTAAVRCKCQPPGSCTPGAHCESVGLTSMAAMRVQRECGHTLHDCACRAPLLEHVEANRSLVVHVGVEHGCGEGDLWSLEGVVRREGDIELESAPLPHGSGLRARAKGERRLVSQPCTLARSRCAHTTHNAAASRSGCGAQRIIFRSRREGAARCAPRR